jgi:hypothetical protein
MLESANRNCQSEGALILAAEVFKCPLIEQALDRALLRDFLSEFLVS